MQRASYIIILALLGATFIFKSCSTKTSTSKNEEIKQEIVTTKPEVEKKIKRNIKEFPDLTQTEKVAKYCNQIDKTFKKYGWGKSECLKVNWNHVRDSYLGRPLIWTVFGTDQEKQDETNKEKNLTLILCGVHGDEITPVKFCFDIIHDLSNNPHLYEDRTVVVAPIVTPDSFFRKSPTRTNYRGVDVNRNFPTKDWNKMALKLWKKRYRSDKRRYPGQKPYSEAEVIFQMNLVKRYGPGKIISVHAPLTLLDYDGPGDNGEISNSKSLLANQLLIKMSMKAKGYRIKNYPFFVGSLGNWAGNERNIPTFTLELPTTDYTKHKKYWALFQDAIHSAIKSDFLKSVALDN